MIRLTKKLLFAIEAVLDIAYNGSAAPVRSAEITEREGIPRRYLEPVLQELVREGILVGIRGPSGGYRPDPDGGWVPWSIQVLDVAGGRIVGHHNFLDTDLFAVFGLPARLDG